MQEENRVHKDTVCANGLATQSTIIGGIFMQWLLVDSLPKMLQAHHIRQYAEEVVGLNRTLHPRDLHAVEDS